MIIETFALGRKDAVYERFHRHGRLLPDGLAYVDSWLAAAGDRCFQLMETENPGTLDQWIAQWDDLVAFEVVPLGEPPPAPDGLTSTARRCSRS